ncbi:MAG: 4-hydroxy-tetrahydrodipicolinate reductase [Acidimicrobiales bacterium]
MTRAGVFGACGRMGATVCEAVLADSELELVAAVDPAGAGQPVAGSDLVVAGDPDSLVDAGAEVAVDFTVRDAAVANLAWCASQGIHAVCGTTGFSDADMAMLGEAFPAGGPLGCVVAPNFAVGAVLMMRFAEIAARWFDTAEIIELHHDAKADAPSGTALLTAARMAAASAPRAGDPTRTVVLAGARGGEGPGGIRVHSVRLRGLVAHQEVLLGTTGQTLTIRHDSYDRTSFMPGVLLAVKAVAAGRCSGLTVGLDELLDR